MLQRLGSSLLLLLACSGRSGEAEPAKKTAEAPPSPQVDEAPASGTPKVASAPTAKADETNPADETDPADEANPAAEPLPEPDVPPPALRYSDRKCALCEQKERERCVTRHEPDGRSKRLGCGEASPTGNYALLTVETGDIEDGSWVLDYVYLGPKGELSRVDEACNDSPSFYCDGPGSFLALEDGRWLQHMGNAGDGTNDQAIADLVSGTRIELPEGEYGVVPHPDGLVAGLYSIVPNLYDEKTGEDAIRVTLACVEVKTAKVHVVHQEVRPYADFDAHADGELRWDGEELVIEPSEGGKALLRERCPPRAPTP